MDNHFKLKNGSGSLCFKGCGRQDKQLNTYDWLADIPGNAEEQEIVEVQFKNTRKGYFKNSNKLKLEKGDIVAVEASPGHDIGTVTLTGRLVPLQMRKANLKPEAEIKRIYRKAKPTDIEKYEEAKAKEHDTMIRSRQIALNLQLNMKIGDVEYQGDGNKAIFYYIADERVDFRQLIKVLAETFRVRIEMKQIGARQEAGRIGGIGPCGRELCCATWMTNFVSVSTSAARYQDISLNPQKLAGQCAKLKCCLNYEVDVYVESQKRLPSKEITLETTEGTFYFFKADILKGLITYSSDKNFMANATTITSRRAFEIINMNKRGEKPEALLGDDSKQSSKRPIDLVEQESLTRFDKKKQANKKKKKKQANRESTPVNNVSNKEIQAPEVKENNREEHRTREERNKNRNRSKRHNDSREKSSGNQHTQKRSQMKIKHLNRLTNKITVCLFILFTACQENIIYHSYQPIHSKGWYRNDTMTYEFNSPMLYDNLHEWQIGIRHLDSYPYQDVWIGVIPITQDSLTQYKTDSIHLYLADSNGNWKGKGIGELRQFTQTNSFKAVSEKSDTIIGFKIFHLMQDNPLPKIYDIGLRIHGH